MSDIDEAMKHLSQFGATMAGDHARHIRTMIAEVERLRRQVDQLDRFRKVITAYTPAFDYKPE